MAHIQLLEHKTLNKIPRSNKKHMGSLNHLFLFLSLIFLSSHVSGSATASSEKKTADLEGTDALLAVLPKVRISRNPGVLSKGKQGIITAEQLRACPPGCAAYMKVIISESALWKGNKDQEHVIYWILVEIVRDSEAVFRLEERFRGIFGCGFGEFNQKDRTILGWMISFGALNLLNCIDSTTYAITPAILENSFGSLVNTVSIEFVGKVIDSCDVLAFADNLPSIKSVFAYFYHNSQGIPTPLLNLATVFGEMRDIDFTHISKLVPFLRKDAEIADLIEKSSQISHHLATFNSAYSHVSLRSFRTALQNFFIKCLPDYSKLGPSNRFSLASLFMVLGNVEQLKRLLAVYPDLPTSIGNSKTLLQLAMESGNFESATYVASLNPSAIFSSTNGRQPPIVQAVVEGVIDLLNMLLPYVTTTEPVYLLDYPEPCSLIRLAIRFGQADKLAAIVRHFNSQHLDYDLRLEFEQELSFLIERSGLGNSRTALLIHPDIWKFIISAVNPNSLYGPEARSLLDTAVIERSVDAARLIVASGGDINYVCTAGPLFGNCLRYMHGDSEMFSALVSLGLNVNVDVIFRDLDEEDGVYFERQRYPSIVNLFRNLNPLTEVDFRNAMLDVALHFNMQSIDSAKQYSYRNKNRSILEFLPDLQIAAQAQAVSLANP
jgi:hypothetical protein